MLRGKLFSILLPTKLSTSENKTARQVNKVINNIHRALCITFRTVGTNKIPKIIALFKKFPISIVERQVGDV